MFHRRFGEVKVSPTTIYGIYLKHKIRFKNIKRGKREIDSQILTTAHCSTACTRCCTE